MDFKINKNISEYVFGSDSIYFLPKLLDKTRIKNGVVILILDDYFQKNIRIKNIINKYKKKKLVFFISTKNEPSTIQIDHLKKQITESLKNKKNTCQSIVGIGGGSILDITIALSLMINNSGKTEKYQGWDKIPKKGINSIGIPTISGTGAETSRTCVLINKKKNLKLGINSNFSVFDQLILDPNLTKTVPLNQYFYTAMDTYIHSFESLNGSFRNSIADNYNISALNLCEQIFQSQNIKSKHNRSKLMTASYMGGIALSSTLVGLVHPFSAGLSVVFGIHHCLANCIAMRGMKEFYPKEYKYFWQVVKKHKIKIPKITKNSLDRDNLNRLFLSTIIHEKPLENALGRRFKTILSKDKVFSIFKLMS